MKQTRLFCLASTSPRRRELLEQFGLKFEVYGVNVDEDTKPGETPEAYVGRMADLKARMAMHRFGNHVILAGDTTVVLDGHILGKPRDRKNAAEMLANLSGKTHRVLSAYELLDGKTGEQSSGVKETLVTFRALPPEWITYYSNMPEAMDKAGGYAIQGVGAAMVDRIQGSYSTVVGFPMEAILWALMEKGWVIL